jgi:FixJ family two-component response regulator
VLGASTEAGSLSCNAALSLGAVDRSQVIMETNEKQAYGEVSFAKDPQEGAPVRSAPLISVVDDDPAVAEAVVSLMESVGFAALGFGSAEEYLGSAHVARTACLILDVRMPGMGGLALQRRLAADSHPTPIVFITAQADTDAAAEALHLGAVAFLLKPFSQESLLAAVCSAVGAEAPQPAVDTMVQCQ